MADTAQTPTYDDGAGTTTTQSMEANDVFQQYLTLVNSLQLGRHLGRHSMLDWFGRSVPSGDKIQSYFRFEVNTQYEHAEFGTAMHSEPIEVRPTHMRSKIYPNSDPSSHISRLNRVPVMTLRLYADSDVEDEIESHPSRSDVERAARAMEMEMLKIKPIATSEMEMDVLEETSLQSTPERAASNATTPNEAMLDELTPPASEVKERNESDVKETTTGGAVRTLFEDSSSSSTFTSNTTGTTTSSDEADTPDSDLDKTQPQRAQQVETRGDYTQLHYLVVDGVLRTKTSRISRFIDITPSSWERKVRIKLSYRKCLSDQTLQFALIIYEHVNGPGQSTRTTSSSRRNLILEFDMEPIDMASSSSDAAIARSQNSDVNDETHITAASYTAVSMRTPNKLTPPSTPRRRHRQPHQTHTHSSLKRHNQSPSSAITPKRSAARNLRL